MSFYWLLTVVCCEMVGGRERGKEEEGEHGVEFLGLIVKCCLMIGCQ